MKKTYQSPAMQRVKLPSLLKAPQTSNVSGGGDDGGDGNAESKSFSFGETLWDDTVE